MNPALDESTALTLAETQALFHAAVTRADGDRSLEIQRCFTGSPELTAAERVEIYADMYLWRLVDALREDYPKLAALLGDERFCALAEAYVREHPSSHHDLGRVGVHLAAFLRARPDPERPDLADLAALEWARSETFAPARSPAIAGAAPRCAPAPPSAAPPARRFARLSVDDLGHIKLRSQLRQTVDLSTRSRRA